MTNALKQESVQYFEWNVQTPAEYDTRVISEKFLCQDCSCNLEFSTNSDGKSRLYFKSNRELQPAVAVTICILSDSEGIIDHLKISITSTCQNIWTHSKALLSCSLSFELIFRADYSEVDRFQELALSPKNCNRHMRSWFLKKDGFTQIETNMNTEVCMKILFENFTELLEKGLYHDVELKCGEHSIMAHKLVLSTRSSVFREMLKGDILEGQAKVLQIKDMDSSYFQDFIRYLYTNIIPELNFDKAKALYKAGHTYDVRNLIFRCSEYLQSHLSPENAFECYNLADAHSDQTLKDKVKTYLSEKKKKTPFVPVML